MRNIWAQFETLVRFTVLFLFASLQFSLIAWNIKEILFAYTASPFDSPSFLIFWNYLFK